MAQPDQWVVARLRSFMTFSKTKLEAALAESAEQDAEEHFQELVSFTKGLVTHVKNIGATASVDLKTKIAQVFSPVWDLFKNEPGPDLKGGEASVLEKDLNGLIDTLLEGLLKEDAITYMWTVLDKPNRVEYGNDGFELDMQSKGKFGRDTCSRPLLWVNEGHGFWEARTTKTFIALLDNYEREVGKEENFTQQEKEEMAHFLDALGDTKVMEFCLHYLQLHGKDARCKQLKSMQDFENLLFDLWLAPYRRVRKNDSSGFEHVFVGEEKNGKITGLHNWVQYYIEEKKGNINYLGWKGKQDSDYDDDVNIVSIAFAWQDDDPEIETKPMSTMLCGSTIEFEMALLTLIFLAGEQNGKTTITLGSERCEVTCFAQRQRYGGPKIASAFLEIA